MNLNNVARLLGLKKCFYIAPKAIFSRYLLCFLHITHPKGCVQYSTKNSKIALPCRKNAFSYANASPQTCARSNLSRWGWKNASTLLRRFHGNYNVFCTSHIPKAAGNIAPKIQKLSSLDKPNIALQDLKIKKPPHRVNAHLGLYADAKKNVLVLAHLARNSRIRPYSPPRSQHSPPSGPIRL